MARRRFFVASSTDLGVLWREERIDALERRRRITVFAAQYHWTVDIRADGRAARFERTVAASRGPTEVLHRSHE